MKNEFLLSIFIFFICSVNVFCAKNSLKPIYITIINNDKLSEYSLDSLCSYNSKKLSAIPLGKGTNGKIFIPNDKYEGFTKSDSIFLYIGINDYANKNQFSIVLPFTKDNLEQQLTINLTRQPKKSKYYFYFGKRKGYNKWINVGKRKVRQYYSVNMNNGYSIVGAFF